MTTEWKSLKTNNPEKDKDYLIISIYADNKKEIRIARLDYNGNKPYLWRSKEGMYSIKAIYFAELPELPNNLIYSLDE